MNDRICSRGHDVSGDNKLTRPNGYTVCKACSNIAQQLRYQRMREPRTLVPVGSQENASLK